MTETCHRSRVSRDVRRVMYAANVAEAVGDITHGCFHAQTLEHIPPPKRVRYLK